MGVPAATLLAAMVVSLAALAGYALYLRARRQLAQIEMLRSALKSGHDVSAQMDRVVGTDLRRGVRLLTRALACILVGIAIGTHPPRPEDANDAITVMWILVGVSAFPGLMGLVADWVSPVLHAPRIIVNETDDELIVDVQLTGNPQAFATLVSRYQGLVRATLVRFTGHPDSADDLAQDTFIKAYDRIRQYQPGRSFSAWLGGIAYREFLQHHRREKSRYRKLQRLQDDTDADLTFEQPGDMIDIENALATLETAERNAIILAHGFGMSHSEIAAAMAVPLGTVKTRINRGLTKLRGRMSDD